MSGQQHLDTSAGPVAGSGEPTRPPSIDALARSVAHTGLPAPLLVDAARNAVKAGEPHRVEHHAGLLTRLLLQPVVNGTGVLLHTNLGRAPLPMNNEGFATNLEFDLSSGARGSRHAAVGHLAATLCAAEAAIVVNNGAAAVLLALAAVAAGHEVAVSRGESVEIGGGFRIPDVAAQSGARLVDVGTTNRTRLDDYQRALSAPDADVACVLKVHPSNFTVEGFTSSTSVRQLATLSVPTIVDLGSGLVDTACPWLASGPPAWLKGEPGARQLLSEGAALVTFSGDKLLGGPQCGIIVGRSDLVARCAAHPLARALRPGSLIIDSLQRVFLDYLRRDVSRLPFWHMATVDVAVLHQRAEAITATLGQHGTSVSIVDSQALIGAGSTPGVTLPSVALRLAGDHANALRGGVPPIIVRVSDDNTLIDLRSVDARHDDTIVHALAALSVAQSRP